jgi:site-specific recombinase XerD
MQARYTDQRVAVDLTPQPPPLRGEGEFGAPVGEWEIVVTAGAEAPAVRPSTAGAAAPSAQDAQLAIGLDIEGILELFEAWMRLDVGDGRASPLTLASYRCDVKQHLQWLAGHGLTPAAATTFTLKDFRAHLVESYQVSSVGRKLASVRRFYQMAHSHGMLPANPSFGLKSPADQTAQSERIKYLPLMTLKALFAATETARDPAAQVRDKAIVALMAIHGLRVCEVSRLDVGDVDLEAGEAGELAVLGKGRKRRKVLLTDETRVAVEKWLAVRRLVRTSPPAPSPMRGGGETAEALFLALSGPAERIGMRGLRTMVDGYLRKIGAKKPGVSCHALRHTYATQSLAAGASLLAISGSMGHSSVTTTQVYAQIVDKARNNPAKFLVGLL